MKQRRRLLVIVIVAVLASIAVPSYRQYIVRTHRAEAKTALMQLAAAQEKFYLQSNTYAANSALSTAPPAGLGIPGTTKNGWYTITINTATAATFSATATAVGTQTQDSDCATFTIDALGVKGGGPATTCWE